MIRSHDLAVLSFAAVILTAQTVAAQGIYRCVDAEGRVSFSNDPPSPGKCVNAEYPTPPGPSSKPAAEKGEAATVPIFSQTLAFTLPAGWKLGFENVGESIHVVEYVPEGQTVENWREMITLQGFRDVDRNPPLTPKGFLGLKVLDHRKVCGERVVAISIGDLRVDGHDAHAAIIGCGSVPADRPYGLKKGQGEVAYFIAIRGRKDMYLIHRAMRGPEFDPRSPPITPANGPQLMGELEPIKLCERGQGPVCAPTVSSTQKVTLRTGETYDVETVRGLPVGFASEQIRVQDLGGTALMKADQFDAPPWAWILVAELRAKGRFDVTVTTPLDRSASTSFEISGPGRIAPQFFPQAEYPLMWQGIDQPGTHWFPFHFVFQEKSSGRRFEFTQWAQIDDRTVNETRELIEKAKQGTPKRR